MTDTCEHCAEDRAELSEELVDGMHVCLLCQETLTPAPFHWRTVTKDDVGTPWKRLGAPFLKADYVGPIMDWDVGRKIYLSRSHYTPEKLMP